MGQMRPVVTLFVKLAPSLLGPAISVLGSSDHADSHTVDSASRFLTIPLWDLSCLGLFV
jgi:hypothetical protein